MADLAITPANVIPVSTGNLESGTAGATITAGMVVYKDPADSKFRIADANSGTAAARVPYGIALNNASSGQPLQVLKGGQITIGGTVAVGKTYILSATDNVGAIAPDADAVTGWYKSIIGIGINVTDIMVGIQVSGVAVP